MIAEREFVKIQKDCAFSDKFLKFGMAEDMAIRFSKTIANKVGLPPGGWFALNSIWPPCDTDDIVFQLLFTLEHHAIPLFLHILT